MKVGDEMELALEMAETHVFDPEDEKTLV